MKTIGLMGGMGWEGSAIYYRSMNRAVRARLGGYHSAHILMESFDFEFIATAKGPQEFEAVQGILVDSAVRLEKAGADLLVIACNTVHRLAPRVETAAGIPLLHIADSAGAVLAKDGHKRVGLMGTRSTVRAPFYRTRLAQRFDLDVVVPTPSDIEEVDRMINEEIARGDNPRRCAPRLDGVVKALKAEGCTAVVLACTDFGIAFDSEDEQVLQRDLPLYDTAVVHALAAVDLALA